MTGRVPALAPGPFSRTTFRRTRGLDGGLLVGLLLAVGRSGGGWLQGGRRLLRPFAGAVAGGEGAWGVEPADRAGDVEDLATKIERFDLPAGHRRGIDLLQGHASGGHLAALERDGSHRTEFPAFERLHQPVALAAG